MGIKSPFLSLGIDAWTGKPYELCSKKSLLAVGAIFCLVFVMTLERFSFKLMVDRMESYRYFLCQLMTFLYIPPLFCIVGYKSTQDDFIEEEVTEFPKMRFVFMGILDLAHAMLLFIPGGKVSSPLSVLLMQGSIPLSALLSIAFFCTKYSKIQLGGVFIISFGLILSLIPSFEDLTSDLFVERESAWNTIFYLLAAFPASLSMIYKERTIREQPMDMVYLNAWVSVYQFIGGLLLAPLVFDAEFLYLEQKMSGLECLINGRNEVPTDRCEFGITILFVYVICNVSMNFLILHVIRQTSISVMYGTTLVGFALSFFFMELYQLLTASSSTSSNSMILPSPIVSDLLAFGAIFTGMIMFHWHEDPDVEATTISAEDKEAASLLNDDDDYGLRYM